MDSITIFVMKDCLYCHQAIDFLNSKGIAYRMVSIDNQVGLKEWSMLGTMGVPTFVIGETVIEGFDQNRLKSILKLADL